MFTRCAFSRRDMLSRLDKTILYKDQQVLFSSVQQPNLTAMVQGKFEKLTQRLAGGAGGWAGFWISGHRSMCTRVVVAAVRVVVVVCSLCCVCGGVQHGNLTTSIGDCGYSECLARAMLFCDPGVVLR